MTFTAMLIAATIFSKSEAKQERQRKLKSPSPPVNAPPVNATTGAAVPSEVSSEVVEHRSSAAD
jgi:hypothetical protein